MELSTTAIIITILAAILVAIIPFMPGRLELRKPKDADPLPIDVDYRRSPFALGDSFRSLLDKVLPNPVQVGNHIYKIADSNTEMIVDVVSSYTFVNKTPLQTENLYCVYGELQSGNNSIFSKEIFVAGDTTIGENSRLHSLLCEKNLTLKKNSSVDGWIDVRGEHFVVEEGCFLGHNAVSQGDILLSKNITFTTVYALPIRTYGSHAETISSTYSPLEKHRIEPKLVLHKKTKIETSVGDNGYKKSFNKLKIKENVVVHGNIVTSRKVLLDKRCEIEGTLISYKDIIIDENVVILGDIKSHRNIYLGTNVLVCGNVIAGGKIIIGENCEVRGDVFSQKEIVIESGSIVGQQGTIRSVVARDAIVLHSNVVIYGGLSCLQGIVT